MKTGTSIGYFRSMTIRDFMLTVKDFIEIMEGINEARREAMRHK
jgi:hypothetical protein